MLLYNTSLSSAHPSFHSRCSVLIEGVKYNAEKPSMIGKTFLRLERDFDKHVAYCRDESNAQDFIATNNVVRDFFEVSFGGFLA